VSPGTSHPVRHLRPGDRAAAGTLLDEVVGAGFWSFGHADPALSFVAPAGRGLAGVLLARLSPADEALPEQARPAGSLAATLAPGALVLHVRELAVAPGGRRSGIGGRLLRPAERDGRAGGASLALAYAWLPAGRPEPDSVPFYLHEGYSEGPELPDFYAAASLESGAVCPYCGAPPCRCAARLLLKSLAAAG